MSEDYVTGPGDTLETIGQKLGRAWDELFKANQDTIIGHMARSFTLPHNTSLVVPDAPAEPASPAPSAQPGP